MSRPVKRNILNFDRIFYADIADPSVIFILYLRQPSYSSSLYLSNKIMKTKHISGGRLYPIQLWLSSQSVQQQHFVTDKEDGEEGGRREIIIFSMWGNEACWAGELVFGTVHQDKENKDLK